MNRKEKFLPNPGSLPGHRGYYPVCSAEEWDQLPAVYKAMEWFPIKMKSRFGIEEYTMPEYVVFNVVHIEPYKIRAQVRVHVQEFQKIMFCLFPYREDTIQLYSVCGVYFANGERRAAEWLQDSTTGAFAVVSGGHYVGKQGGFSNFVPEIIEETENGFKRKDVGTTKNRCHYEYGNPFTWM